jgi:hypothetical protein
MAPGSGEPIVCRVHGCVHLPATPCDESSWAPADACDGDAPSGVVTTSAPEPSICTTGFLTTTGTNCGTVDAVPPLPSRSPHQYQPPRRYAVGARECPTLLTPDAPSPRRTRIVTRRSRRSRSDRGQRRMTGASAVISFGAKALLRGGGLGLRANRAFCDLLNGVYELVEAVMETSVLFRSVVRGLRGVHSLAV